jgi:hypothetical protein
MSDESAHEYVQRSGCHPQQKKPLLMISCDGPSFALDDDPS